MNYDEGKPFANQHERRTAERIQTALDEMHSRRKEVQDRRAMGSVAEEDKLLFGAAVLSVFDELRPFRERVEDRWDDPNHLSYSLERLPGEIQMQEREQTVRRGARARVEQELFMPVPTTELLRASYELDDLAHELGFEPGVEEGDEYIDEGGLLEV